jgi:hypothetical protein
MWYFNMDEIHNHNNTNIYGMLWKLHYINENTTMPTKTCNNATISPTNDAYSRKPYIPPEKIAIPPH